MMQRYPTAAPFLFPTAYALLDLWAHPHSPKRLQFAAWALYVAERKLGINILD